ncbi:MAG: tRNA pseudouridine synthase [Chlamydiales bacterium]|jgi:tRNA pseudouridine38-40 synthase|nr:tRNA pseudouridine synthase [Chlamydiales bacterium]
MKYNYRLLLAYDGTAYHGWQIQPSRLSIQQLVQQGCQTLLREEVKVIGSGRTDSGVHALGQVAHFKTTKEVDPYRFLNQLNGILPRDIRCQAVEPADLTFHAQYSAVGKIYRYHLNLNRYQLPFQRLYSYHLRQRLDLNLMRAGALHFLGTHDFTSFANKPEEGSAAKDAVRTLERLDISEENGEITLEFQADGFLYKMVRNITGTLLDIAAKRISVESLPDIFAAKDRRRGGMAAPPHGLFLFKVLY